ncbi:MAG TPA: argininosuccinate synthase [Bacteroidota bacterium]|nr:argininosuccinate synthase [Bacteroidota bacterium]
MSKQKVVVAYSGGLDTSVMVKWMSEKYDAEVITATGDLGQSKELDGLQAKAYATGAKKAYIKDLKNEFLEEYVFPTLKAGALYEGMYPMATSIGRPLLAKYMVEVARQEGASIIAHGCTGKGNDQVRFEVAIAALAPDLKAIAPLREWEFRSREEEMAYAKSHGIPVSATVKSPYSIDDNIWGTSIECGILEDPMAEPPADAYQRTTDPALAPDTPAYVDIEFLNGIPVVLNGEKLPAVELVSNLNRIAGAHGVGRIDLVENRLVGIKSREVYEAPAATVLHFAHAELERLTLDKPVMNLKSQLANEYANLVYNGLWYSPLRNSLDAFVQETQKTVTGLVRVKLFKGRTIIAGRTSAYSLYNAHLATYTEEDTFDHKASEGFIKIFALPTKTFHQVQEAVKINGAAVHSKEVFTDAK